MAEKMGLSEPELRRRVPITVMTRGEAGALDHGRRPGTRHPPGRPRRSSTPPAPATPSARASSVGMRRGFSWPTVGRMAALTAVYAIEHPGTQEHGYSVQDFITRYEANYGSSAEVQSLLNS